VPQGIEAPYYSCAGTGCSDYGCRQGRYWAPCTGQGGLWGEVSDVNNYYWYGGAHEYWQTVRCNSGSFAYRMCTISFGSTSCGSAGENGCKVCWSSGSGNLGC
jgi:hypothetical protein